MLIKPDVMVWVDVNAISGVPQGTPISIRQSGKGSVFYVVADREPVNTEATGTLKRDKAAFLPANSKRLFVRTTSETVELIVEPGFVDCDYQLVGSGNHVFGRKPNEYQQPLDSDSTWVMGDETLHIAPKSALDLSNVKNTAIPAGSKGRIRISSIKSNKLIEGDNENLHVRFNIACYAGTLFYSPLPESKSAITAGAVQLARCGYNAVRIHGIENLLMSKMSGEAAFEPIRLDSFYFFLAECKRLGIYWIIDAASFNLYKDMQGASNRYSYTPDTNMKSRIYTEQNIRDQWKRGYASIYNRVNPYTGMTTLEDPALVLVELYNESSYPLLTMTAFPNRWLSRTIGATVAAKTWGEWLQDPTASHGYANIAALNTSWGTSFADFTAAAADPMPAINTATANTPKHVDIGLFIIYLEEHMAQFYQECLDEWGYTGLSSMHNLFAGNLTNREVCKLPINKVANTHGYHSGSNDLAVGATLDGAASKPLYANETWLLASAMMGGDKPKWFGEYGWPCWSRYRAQYPLLSCVARFNNAASFSYFSQGDFFTPVYRNVPGEQGKRFRRMYPYMNQTDPVADFVRVLIAVCYMRGDVNESSKTTTIPYSDRYYGLNPKNSGRTYRLHSGGLYPLAYGVTMSNVNYKWVSDTSDDSLASTLSFKSLKDLYNEAIASGAVVAGNKGYQSVLLNNGSILGVSTTDLVNGIQATVTSPIIQVASHTLVDEDKVMITNIVGSGGTWPGTAPRNALYSVKVVDATHLQVINLNLTGATIATFTSGTWCEAGNVIEAGNGEWGWSRRDKYAWINTSKTVFLSNISTTLPKTIGGVTFEALTAGSSTFVTSLDGSPITSSKKLLVGLVGDAINSGMAFSDDHATLSATGEYPVQISDSYVRFKLVRTVTGRATITPLTRSGEPVGDAMSLLTYANGYKVNCRNVDGVLFWLIELKE